MPTIKQELERIFESNHAIRESAEELGERVTDLAKTLDIAKGTVVGVQTAQRRLRRVVAVLAGIAALVLIALIGVGFVTVKVIGNSDEIATLQADVLKGQCEQTGFFLDLADEPPAKPETAQEKKVREDFVVVYQGVYKDLDCAHVLKPR